MSAASLLDRMHQDCCQRLQALGTPEVEDEPYEETRGVLPPMLLDLTVPVVAFYTTWYLIAGALGFLGNRALSKVARHAGWQDPAATGLREVEAALRRMEAALWALSDSIKDGRQADTRTLEGMVDQLKPALDQIADRLRGQVEPGQLAEVQALASARLEQLHVPPPMADLAGPQVGRIVVNGLQPKSGQAPASGSSPQ
jgi:hypothetical protein